MSAPRPRGNVLRGIPLGTTLVVAAALVAGCSDPGGAPGAPVREPSAAAAIPTDAVASPPQTSLVPIASEEPITYPPDNVWAFLATGGRSGATGLDDAIERADLVVVGRIETIDAGEAFGPNDDELGWYAVATLAIDRVIHGDAPADSIQVPFMLVFGGDRYPNKELRDLQRSLPRDPALLFLRSWSTYFERSGAEIPAWLAGLDRPDIYRTIGIDGAIRVTDGVLDPPTYEDFWTRSLAGMPIDQVADEVSRAVGD